MEDAADGLEALGDQLRPLFDRLGTDVLLYKGDIVDSTASILIENTCARERRSNVLLIIETFGGSGRAAYRIARCLRSHYTSVTIIVDNYCKSAGTLIALAADEIVMSAAGELGPLDVQLNKPDELGGDEFWPGSNASIGHAENPGFFVLREQLSPTSSQERISNYHEKCGGNRH